LSNWPPAVIDLQRDADGKGNWPGAAIRDAQQPDREARPPRWQTMKIGAMTLSDVVLSMRDAVTGLEVSARADSEPESFEPSAGPRYQLSGYRKTPFAGQRIQGRWSRCATRNPFVQPVDTAARRSGRRRAADLSALR
jgi:hypothetical protein